MSSQEIAATIPGAARPRAIAWYGVASGLGSIAGQVFGGALITANLADLGWRMIFLANVPIGVIAALLAWRMLPTTPRRQQSSLDPIGAMGAAMAVAAILIPLTVGRSAGWPVWAWGCMVAAIPITVATLRWERYLSDRGALPLFDVTLLWLPMFRAGLLANAAFMCFFGSFMFTLTLFLQFGLDLNAFQAGLVFAPAGVTFSISALVGRWLLARHGRRVLLMGQSLIASSLGLIAINLSLTGTHTSLALIVCLTALASFGNGIVLPSLIGAALVEVTSERAGLAAGVLSTVQQFASASGVAIIGALFFAAIPDLRDTGDYAVGMTWATAANFALVLLVTSQSLFRIGVSTGQPS